MNTGKKIVNHRALVTLMTGLMGIILPISGFILHAYSDHRIVVGRHLWFTIHVFGGIIFLSLVVWHIFLNRAIFLKYLKSGSSSSLPLSREACLAIVIIIISIILVMIHSH